jgi:hypothetical protein
LVKLGTLKYDIVHNFNVSGTEGVYYVLIAKRIATIRASQTHHGPLLTPACPCWPIFFLFTKPAADEECSSCVWAHVFLWLSFLRTALRSSACRVSCALFVDWAAGLLFGPHEHLDRSPRCTPRSSFRPLPRCRRGNNGPAPSLPIPSALPRPSVAISL